MRKCLIMILLITLINNTFAQNAVTINKGEPASFTGILVKPERMEELIKSDKKILLLEAKFEAQDELIDYHRVTAKEARGKLLEEQIKGNMKGIYGFLTGVLVMSIAFKVSQEVTR